MGSSEKAIAIMVGVLLALIVDSYVGVSSMF